MSISKQKRPIAGYCQLHKKPLRYCDITEEGCIDRKEQRGKEQCSYFVKDLSHPIWEEKEKQKAERKAAKALRKLQE